MIERLTEKTVYDCWTLANQTKVFTKEEMTCLADDLRDCVEGNSDITCVYSEPENHVAGFINFGPAPITSGSWFIYWIAVDKDKQGEGIGQKLIEYAESYVKKQKGRIIYIETSANQAKFKPARQSYQKAGYKQVAHLKNYYKVGDGKYVYAKTLRQTKPKRKVK